jgi:hypothetical protein
MMGFHVCEYCRERGVAPEHSSGDVMLAYADGRVYQVPDMLPHYVLEHGYAPPAGFVGSVMSSHLVGGGRGQTKALPTRVGYLSGPLPACPGQPDDGATLAFLSRLTLHMREAQAMGLRTQTRAYRGGA